MATGFGSGRAIWVALHLPGLPVEIFQRSIAEPGPLAVSVVRRNRPTLLACNRPAASLGARPGMAVPAARAIVSALQVMPRDERRERDALEEVAAWAYQFTPTVSLADAGVLLEVGGSLRLFGGLESLLDRLSAGLAALGFDHRLACAPTPLGAWWLARSGDERRLADLAALGRALESLPPTVLAASPATHEALAGMGLRTLAALRALPRNGLARRFGQDLLDQLDRAWGGLSDPRPLFQPPATFDRFLELPAEVGSTEALLFAARRLLVGLEGFLLGRMGAVDRFALRLGHADRPASTVEIGLAAPTRDLARMVTVLRERLARETLVAPVRDLRLVAGQVVPLGSHERDLFAAPGEEAESWRLLVERLRARLGTAAVHGLALRADHRPERAWAPAEPGQPSVSPPSAVPRPLWLLERPRRLELDGGRPRLAGELRPLAGPERVETGWWDEDTGRDYFVAENPDGARFWIYREAGGGWWLQGVFG